MLPPLPRCAPPATSTDVPERIEGMPLTDVRLVSIKLITLAELKLVGGWPGFLSWSATQGPIGRGFGLFSRLNYTRGLRWCLECRQHFCFFVQAISTPQSQITDRGAEGRRKLSELLQGPERLVSSIRRESVL